MTTARLHPLRSRPHLSETSPRSLSTRLRNIIQDYPLSVTTPPPSQTFPPRGGTGGTRKRTRCLLKSHADITRSRLPTHLREVSVKSRLTFPSELSVSRKTPAEAAQRRGSSQKQLEEPGPERSDAKHRARPEHRPAGEAPVDIGPSGFLCVILLCCRGFDLHAKAGERDCGTAEISAELHGFRHSDR